MQPQIGDGSHRCRVCLRQADLFEILTQLRPILVNICRNRGPGYVNIIRGSLSSDIRSTWMIDASYWIVRYTLFKKTEFHFRNHVDKVERIRSYQKSSRFPSIKDEIVDILPGRSMIRFPANGIHGKTRGGLRSSLNPKREIPVLGG